MLRNLPYNTAMGALTFLISFATYAWTAYPSITAQDSGELIAGPATLSIVHPPGYPLYTILGHFWTTLLPFGSLAFRVNLFSAVMTSVALLGVYRLARRWLTPWMAGCLALSIGWVGPIWSQAVTAEVYALNLACTAWLLMGLYSITNDERGMTNSKKWMVLLGLGISLSNHHLTLLWMPVVGILLIRDGWRTWWWGGLLIGLGLMIYLMLMMRSLANPPMDWGNPETWETWWAHILRRQYGAVSSGHRTWAGLFKQSAFAAERIWEAWSWTLPVAVIGWAVMIRSSKKFGWVAFGLFLLLSVGIAVLTNFRPIPMQAHQLRAFFTPAILLTGLAIGWALAFIQLRMKNLELRIINMILPLFVGAGTFVHGALEMPNQDHQREHIVRDYALDLLACVPSGGRLVVTGDFPTFPLGYVVHAEGYGRFVNVGDDVGAVFPRVALTPEFLNLAEVPVFSGMSSAVLHDRQFEFIPEGLIYRAVPRGTADHTPQAGSDLWRRLSCGAPLSREPVAGSFTRYLRQQYYAFGLAEWTWAKGNHTLAWERYEKIIRDPMAGETLIQTIGTLLERRGALSHAETCFVLAGDKAVWTPQPLLSAARLASAQGAWDRAEHYLRLALERDAESATVHFQWGNFLNDRARKEEAVAAYRRAIALDPTFIAARKNLGALYLDLQRFPQAIEETVAAIKLNPADYQLFANLGAMYHAAGDRARAVAAWEQALRLHPNDPQLHALIARFGEASRP